MLLICVLGVAGCGLLPDQNVDLPVLDEATDTATPSAQIRPQIRPEALDTAPRADTPVADSEVTVGTLGRTVASLGNAAEPGLWLKTPLVSREQTGQVFYPDTGKTVAVTLIPIDGPKTAGSRMSLAAMQAIGAPLTGLPEVDVLAG